MNIENIKKAREIIGVEIRNNIKEMNKREFKNLCSCAGFLDTTILIMKRKEKLLQKKMAK